MSVVVQTDVKYYDFNKLVKNSDIITMAKRIVRYLSLIKFELNLFNI